MQSNVLNDLAEATKALDGKNFFVCLLVVLCVWFLFLFCLRFLCSFEIVTAPGAMYRSLPAQLFEAFVNSLRQCNT